MMRPINARQAGLQRAATVWLASTQLSRSGVRREREPEVVAHDVGVGHTYGGVLVESNEPVGVRGGGGGQSGQCRDNALHGCITPHHRVDVGNRSGGPTLAEKPMVLGLQSRGVRVNERAGLGDNSPLLSQAVNAWSKALLAAPRAALSAVNWAPAGEALAGPALTTAVDAATATDNAAAAATKIFFMGSSRRVVGTCPEQLTA